MQQGQKMSPLLCATGYSYGIYQATTDVVLTYDTNKRMAERAVGAINTSANR